MEVATGHAADSQQNDPLLLDELLSEILLTALALCMESHSSEAASFLERMRRVCKRWDRVVVNTPELWTTVTWDWRHFHIPPAAYGLEWSHVLSGFRDVLYRSEYLPLDLELHNRHTRRPPFSALSNRTLYTLDAEEQLLMLMNEIRLQSPRVQSLRLTHFNELMWPLAGAWVSLTSLTLNLNWKDYTYDSYWHHRAVPLVLPPDSIPHLRRLRISNKTITIEEELRKENIEFRVLSGIRLSSLKVVHLLHCYFPDYKTFLQKCTLDRLTLEQCVGLTAGLQMSTAARVTFHDNIINLFAASTLFSDALTHAYLDWSNEHHELDILLRLPTLPMFPYLIVVQLIPSGPRIYVIETVLRMAPMLRALRLGQWLDPMELEDVIRIFLPDQYMSSGGLHQVAQHPNGFAPNLKCLELLFHPHPHTRPDGATNNVYFGPELLLTLLTRRPELKVVIAIATHDGEPLEHPIVERYSRLRQIFPTQLALTHREENVQPFQPDDRETLDGVPIAWLARPNVDW